MKKLIELKTIEKDSHHMYTYENGKKTPIPDDGVVFCYLAEETENGRMLKATEWPDRAGSIDGIFVLTDEITQEGGKPCVDGKTYDVWGIGEDENCEYVLVSARGDKFITAHKPGYTKYVSHPNQEDKKEAYELLYDIYEMLIEEH